MLIPKPIILKHKIGRNIPVTIEAVDTCLEPLGLEVLLETGHKFPSEQSQTKKAMRYHGKKYSVEKSSAGSTTTGVDTPTSDTDSTMDIPDRDATLQSGQRYVLIERQSGSVLIAVGEDAVLQTCETTSAFDSQWHWHWDCVDDDGWMTLRNRITGNYLGTRSTFWSWTPAVKVQSRGDGFTARLVVTRSCGGRQTLLALCKEGLWRIVGGKAPDQLGLARDGGLEWECIRIESEMSDVLGRGENGSG
ncbi:hypothetical protein E4U14_007976 [Claviceps sp. LM454 group G7]|nr:hypothetical protein E4U14_007976 [Claviceps sp. LM454 group G7]